MNKNTEQPAPVAKPHKQQELASASVEPSAYDKTEINCFAQDLYDQKMREGKHGHYESMFHVIHQCIKKVSPPASKPLTDEQISNLWCEVTNTDFVTADTHEFARAIEAAHGIMSVPDGKGDA